MTVDFNPFHLTPDQIITDPAHFGFFFLFIICAKQKMDSKD